MSNTVPLKRDYWPLEDSLAITKLAQAGVKVFNDIILPSGYRLTADEANSLIDAYRTEAERS